jgi:hypothetical protein
MDERKCGKMVAECQIFMPFLSKCEDGDACLFFSSNTISGKIERFSRLGLHSKNLLYNIIIGSVIYNNNEVPILIGA